MAVLDGESRRCLRSFQGMVFFSLSIYSCIVNDEPFDPVCDYIFKVTLPLKLFR